MSPTSIRTSPKRISAPAVRKSRREYTPDVGATPGQIQTRLQQRRPQAIRRHAIRTVRRLSLLVVGDLAATALACAALELLANALRLLPHPTPLPWGIDVVLSASPQLIAFSVVLALALTGNYHRRSREQATLDLLKGSALAALLLSWGVISARGAVAAIGVFIVMFALLWTLPASLRRVMRGVAAKVTSPDRWAVPAVVIGPRGSGRIPGQEEIPISDRDYRVVGFISTGLRAPDFALGTLEDLGSIIDQLGVETVIIPSALSDAELANVFDVCESAGCECLYSVRSIRIAGNRTRLVWRGEEPFFELGTPVLRAQQLFWKRCFDLAVAGTAMVLVAPLMALIAAAIRIDSRGPVLFSQQRAGLGGRGFRMLKFRTMRMGADAEKPQLAHLNHTGDSRLFKIPNDPRITRVGSILRRWSLDELPQIWNVLRGDMSLVGPRPFFETDLDEYEAHHFRRLGAKPGITGLWQVSGRSSVIDFEEVVRLDRQYIENWSFWLELTILLRTLPAVLQRRGAL